jgi:Tn3 transposase DDE domain
MLVKASLELPAFSTLDEIASRIRREVNAAIFEQVASQIALPDRVRLDALLDVVGPTAKRPFNRLRAPAGRATWSGFREQVAHLRWVDSLGRTERWLDGIAESKIADFAREAAVADAGVMRDVAPAKRTVLACMVHVARTRARDDVAEMFCKRMASITERAKAELDEIRAGQEEISERLIGHYQSVLACLDPRNPASEDAVGALRLARRAVEPAAGLTPSLPISRRSRPTTPTTTCRWSRGTGGVTTRRCSRSCAPSSSRRPAAVLSVLAAVEHALAYSQLTRDYIPDHAEGAPVDVSFASEQWQRLLRDRGHPGRLDRRHFEACVFTYLASELRTGDIAVRGSEAYANWAGQLLPGTQCEGLLEEFCSEAGLPTTAAAFTDALRAKLAAHAAAVDAGFPENTDLTIDQATGVPTLKRRRAKNVENGGLVLEELIKQRMPERTLLEILARTAYWLEWWRRFGPASGSDPKLQDPLLRYVLTTFTYGCNLGPAQAARHIRGVSAHELGAEDDRGAALHDREAQPRGRRRRQRLPPARSRQGLGRREDGRRRRHPCRHADRQPPGRVAHPLRRLRRDRLPPRRRQLHRALLALHPLRRLGRRLHHRRTA